MFDTNKPGTRVGAILSANNGVLKFLGYGIYEGDFPPPGTKQPSIEELRADPDLIEMRDSLLETSRKGRPDLDPDAFLDELIAGYLSSPFKNNPRIRLDSGDVVWGRECWWGDEERVRAEVSKYKQVKMVKIVRDANGEYDHTEETADAN